MEVTPNGLSGVIARSYVEEEPNIELESVRIHHHLMEEMIVHRSVLIVNHRIVTPTHVVSL